jgi:hypothetical protein
MSWGARLGFRFYKGWEDWLDDMERNSFKRGKKVKSDWLHTCMAWNRNANHRPSLGQTNELVVCQK